MDKLLSIQEAAKVAGVSAGTLRRWERQGKLIPDRTPGKQRRYKLSQLRPHLFREKDISKNTVAYARVSSYDQKADQSNG